jgi:hypothetical protein
MQAPTALILIAVVLGAATARAETLTLGGRTVILEPPAGYCALDPARQNEADIIAFNDKMQQPHNHMVMQLADCGELAEFRAGTRQNFERYGQYFAPLSEGAVKPITDRTRASFLAEGARELPKIESAAIVDEVTAKLREGAGGAVAGAQFLGVLKQDDAGVYLGIAVGKITVGDQTVSAGAMGVVGLTLVNEISVSLGLYRANVGPEAVPDLLAKIQQTLAAIIRANAEIEAREEAGRGGWQATGFDAVVGGLIGAAIGLAAWAWYRRGKTRAGPST